MKIIWIKNRSFSFTIKINKYYNWSSNDFTDQVSLFLVNLIDKRDFLRVLLWNILLDFTRITYLRHWINHVWGVHSRKSHPTWRQTQTHFWLFVQQKLLDAIAYYEYHCHFFLRVNFIQLMEFQFCLCFLGKIFQQYFVYSQWNW
jgi:hypothetical protein